MKLIYVYILLIVTAVVSLGGTVAAFCAGYYGTGATCIGIIIAVIASFIADNDNGWISDNFNS